VIAPVFERIDRLPTWAQPAAKGALLFLAYTVFKLLISLPQLSRSPREWIIAALLALVLSPSLGAVLGFLYGQYRRLRELHRGGG
jgi:hypothetical protein